MYKITKLLISLLVISIYSTQSYADKREWICNAQSWDCVYSINKEGKHLVFRTSQGVKKYNQVTGKWSYERSNLTLKDHNKKILDRASDFTHLIPKNTIIIGWPYYRGISVDNYEHPRYLLVRETGEDGVTSRNKIIDLDNGIVYLLPHQYSQVFRSMYVTEDNIWLGSTKSIAKITKKEEKEGFLTYFTTISDKSYVRQPFIYKDQIYYISNYGLVSVSQDGKIYDALKLLNKKYKVNRLMIVKDEMLLLVKERPSNIAKGLLLIIFKTNDSLYKNIQLLKDYKIVPTGGANYIDHLIVKNDYMFAFGHYQRWVEGGEYSDYGGSFRYSYKKKNMKNIAVIPIDYMDLNKKIAVSRTDNVDASITIKILSFDNKWQDTKNEDIFIFYPNKKYVGSKMRGKVFRLIEGDIWNGKKVEISDPKIIENVIHMAKAKNMNKIDKTKIKKIRNILGKNIRTIKTERGKVEIQYFDQE